MSSSSGFFGGSLVLMLSSESFDDREECDVANDGLRSASCSCSLSEDMASGFSGGSDLDFL